MSKSFSAAAVANLSAPAEYLANLLKPGTVVCFTGEMGAGKTTFIKALLHKLGVNENIDSPTFAVVNEYRLPDKTPVFHFDFYRLNSLQEALDIGLEDYLDAGGICLMEWPDLVRDFLPDEIVEVTIREVNAVREIIVASKFSKE